MSNRSRRRHLMQVGLAAPAAQHLEAVARYQERVVSAQDQIIANQEEQIRLLVRLLERAGGYLDMDKPGAYALMAEMAGVVADHETWQQAQQDAARARGAADD